MMRAAVPCVADPAISVRVVDNEAEFERLRSGWNSLVDRSPQQVFLRHEWFSAAWAWRRTEGAQLWIVCAYAGDRLAGVMPLLRPLSPGYGGSRFLRFLSVPDAHWCDVLVDSEFGPSVGRAFVAHLVERAAQWDVLCLDRLDERSQAERWLAPALAEWRMAVRLDTIDCNPFVDVSSPWSNYEATLSRSLKKTRNLAANRLARSGRAQLHWVTARTAGADDVRRFMDDAVKISSRSWKQGTGNTLECPGPQAFIRALTEAALSADWLSLWLLRMDDAAVAMEYQLVAGGHIYALRADFDDRYKDVSPGTYLNYRLLSNLFAGGFSRYYMGPGKNAYKSRWSRTSEPVKSLTSYAPTVRGRAGELWSEVKPRLRSWKDRLTR